MRFLFVILLCAINLQAVLAKPAQVILLRHAEKPVNEYDTHLSETGRARARALVPFLTTHPAITNHGPAVALFATRPSVHGHGVRPQETLEPLAKQLKLEIQTPYRDTDYAALAKYILERREFDGKTVIVCWVHTSLPDLARELGAKDAPRQWKGSVYDRLWVIRYQDEKTKLKVLTHTWPPENKKP